MDYTQLLGYLAALLTTVANLPQTYKIIKTKSTKDISLMSYLILTTGCGLWLAYGILKSDNPLIIANGISTAICIIILVLKTFSKKQLENLNEKIIP